MKLKEIGSGVIALLLLLAASHLSNYLITLETSDVHEFPFVSPWIKVLIPFISVIPGFVIGWFSKSRPLLTATIVGFCAGIIELATVYSSTLLEHADNAGVMSGAGIDDYIASGVAQAIYLCTFTALGVLVRMRVAR